MSLYRPKLKALCGCLVVEVTMVMQMLSDASCNISVTSSLTAWSKKELFS